MATWYNVFYSLAAISIYRHICKTVCFSEFNSVIFILFLNLPVYISDAVSRTKWIVCGSSFILHPECPGIMDICHSCFVFSRSPFQILAGNQLRRFCNFSWVLEENFGQKFPDMGCLRFWPCNSVEILNMKHIVLKFSKISSPNHMQAEIIWDISH
jgi:hypothetical protein